MNERLAAVEDAGDEQSVHGSESGQSDADRRSTIRDDDDTVHRPSQLPATVETQPNIQVGQFQAVAHQGANLPWQYRIENIWGEFSGDRKEWPAFYDSFKASIYENATLAPVQKLQILRAALKGKAAKSIGQWQVRGCNLEPIWNRLKELYDDPYTTSKELLQKVFSLKRLEGPNGNRLQIMSNVVLEVSRTLQALGYPAQHYDLLLIHSAQEKLDEKTSVAWNLHRQSNRPTLAEFTKFLDRQASALTSAYNLEMAHKPRDENDRKRSFNGQRNGNTKGNGNRYGHRNGNGNKNGYHNDNKRFKLSTSQSNQIAVKMENSKCAMCSEDHITRKCPKFLQLKLTNRKDKARAASLCFNCLSPGHTIKDCRAGKCNRCDKKHNSLLCSENPNNRNLTVGQVATKNNKQKGKGKRSQPKQQ